MFNQIRLTNDVLYYYLDSLVIRDGMAHGHGWAFLSKNSLSSLMVELSFSSGRTIKVIASHNHRRDDVAGLHPHMEQARYSGFRFHASPPDEPIQSAFLIIQTVKKEVCRIPLQITLDGGMTRISVRKFILLRLLQKAWRLIKNWQFRRLWQAGVQYTARVPCRQKNLVSTLTKHFHNTANKSALMIIDHDLGGGANMYRERMLSSLIDSGESALLLTFFMPTLQFVLEYRHGRKTKRFALSNLSDIASLAESGLIREIFYNNAVSFHKPGHIPELLVHLKESTGIPYRLALHDYFSVCPSHFLLNDKGNYCNLPSDQECNHCLINNQEGFVKISGAKEISDWRQPWGHCLAMAEEIICFSEASQKILQKVYPALSKNKMSLRPHVLDYLPQYIPAINHNSPLHIGVLGNLTKAKGAEVIQGLAEEILRTGRNIPITIIGTLDAEFRIPFISETGSYTPDKLSKLIEQSGTNLFLFPSIWPETFSYVIAELMALNVPILCFDIGAPAERVRNYKHGHVTSYESPAVLLEELLSYHASLASKAAPNGERI